MERVHLIKEHLIKLFSVFKETFINAFKKAPQYLIEASEREEEYTHTQSRERLYYILYIKYTHILAENDS